MWKRIVTIAFLKSLLSLGCLAQQDSVYTDTVVVVKDPHVVKKQVYAYDVPFSPQDTSRPWVVEVFFAFGKPNSSFPLAGSLRKEQSWTAGLLVTSQVKKWEFGIGASILSNSLQYDTRSELLMSYKKDSTYTKVLDSYIQTIDGKDTTIYITEERDTSITIDYFSEHKQGSHSYQYLQIPLSVGYRIDLWEKKLFFLPRFQAIVSMRIGQKTRDFDPPLQRMPMMGAQLNVGYTFLQRFSILAKVQWQTTMSKYLNRTMLPNNWSSFSYGFGLAMCF